MDENSSLTHTSDEEIKDRPDNLIRSVFSDTQLKALYYLAMRIDIEDNMVRYGLHTIKNFDIKTFIFDFNEAFTLSVGMFAGVGVVNCIPGAYGYVIANIEMILGFIMMGIAIGTLTRRFVR